jgi:hypothetical protein
MRLDLPPEISARDSMGSIIAEYGRRKKRREQRGK